MSTYAAADPFDTGADSEVSRGVARKWGWVMALGVLSIVVGLWLLFNPFSAIFVLALLAGFSLIMMGVGDLMSAGQRTKPWVGYLLGAVYIATGVLAISWPGITLWALAVVTGIGLLVAGVVQIAVSLSERRERSGWGFLLAAGILSVLVGVMALVWPAATVVVLAILLGLRTFIGGIVTCYLATKLREAAHHLSSQCGADAVSSARKPPAAGCR